ncbi:MAG TPA: hypothetical protein VFU74_02245 [Actinocrinis sp.]|nr:hypothetical protein [Actinocrinis sp.]
MTALELPNPGVRTGRQVSSVRGRWSLAAGGTVEARARGRGWKPATLLRRNDVRTLPILSGALIVGDPVHLTVGEIAVAADKTHSVRLTLAEVIALGNRRYATELIASALGEDAGPDETVRLEGYADRVRGGALRLVLNGPAPIGLGGPGARIRVSAVFVR